MNQNHTSDNDLNFFILSSEEKMHNMESRKKEKGKQKYDARKKFISIQNNNK